MGLGVPTHNRKHPDRHTAQGYLAFRPTTGVTMQIDIRVNANDFARQVGVLFKDQIPFATSYAINKTAQQAQIELSREMVRVFDNPTRYTLNGTFIVPSTVKRLYATIKMKDEGGKRSVPADKFITPNVEGGPRRLKGFERALERVGMLPTGWYAVPTRAAPRDQHGNVPAGVINQILSQLKATMYANETPVSRQRKERSLRRKGLTVYRYFAVMPGRERNHHLAPGIYERFDNQIRPVFVYTQRAPRYRPRFDFDGVIKRTYDRNFDRYMTEGFNVALRTRGLKGAEWQAARSAAVAATYAT